MKTAGIFIDNFKMIKFTAALDDAHYKYTVFDFMDGVTLLKVEVDATTVIKLKELVKELELSLKN